MVDTMVWDTVDTDMVTTWARGLLMPNLRPHPKPMLMLPLPTMVDTMAVDTVTDTDTVWDTVDTTVMVLILMPTVLTDMVTTWARGLLMPNPRLMLMLPLMPTVDTTAIDTMVMAVDTDMAVTDISVKLLLKQQIF